MKHSQWALITSTLLLVACLPWLAYSQMGGGGGGMGMGGMGMGGMGMGGMGMGGMDGGMPGGMGGGGRQNQTREIVTYHRPGGPPPSWLVNGLASVESTERLRDAMNQPIRVEKNQEKLEDLIPLLREHAHGITVEIDSNTLEEFGISVDSCRGLPAGEGPLRELLLRALEPQALAYRVLENHIQITTKDAAIDNPTICYYDLAFVQQNSRLVLEILSAIQGSIDPEVWSTNGGDCTILPLGQLLVVRAPESSHHEIERMLARLSLTMNPRNDENSGSDETGSEASGGSGASGGVDGSEGGESYGVGGLGSKRY